MWKRFYWFVLAGILLSGCGAVPSSTPTVAPTTAAAPTPFPTIQIEIDEIPITNDAGEAISRQPGPLWVLISGVDEHGLFAEHELTLLSQPEVGAAPAMAIHSGSAVAVHEIRQTGPQNLQRFYRIQSPTGEAGWISDFYVRRVAYVFNSEGTTVPLYESPGGNELTQLVNVSPVRLISPLTAWWKVETADSNMTGWVLVSFIKESPEPEFLLNQQHEH